MSLQASVIPSPAAIAPSSSPHAGLRQRFTAALRTMAGQKCSPDIVSEPSPEKEAGHADLEGGPEVRVTPSLAYSYSVQPQDRKPSAASPFLILASTDSAAGEDVRTRSRASGTVVEDISWGAYSVFGVFTPSVRIF